MRIRNMLLWIGIGLGTTGFAVLGTLWLLGSPRDAAQAPGPSHLLRQAQVPTEEARLPAGEVERFEEETAPATQLLGTLKLLGTWLADDPRGSLALLQDVENRKRAFVRLGDRVGTWGVTAIERGRILLTTPQGEERRLELDAGSLAAGMADQPAPVVYSSLEAARGVLKPPRPEVLVQASQAITVLSEQDRVVDRQQVLTATQGDLLPFLTQGLSVPHLDGAKFTGLRVTTMADSPWTQKIGLRKGDVVTAVNGKAILDPSKLGEITAELMNAPSIVLTVQRDGHQQELKYHIVN